MLACMAILAVNCDSGCTFTIVDGLDHGLSSTLMAGQAGIVAIGSDSVVGCGYILKGEAVIHRGVTDRTALGDAQVVMGRSNRSGGGAVA